MASAKTFALSSIYLLAFCNNAFADGDTCAGASLLGSALLSPNGGAGICVKNNFLYIAGSFDGFYIFDISDPTDPQLSSLSPTSWAAQSIFTDGNTAYIATGITGIEVHDISDPANPIHLGSHPTSGYAFDIAAQNNIVYVADDDSLLILDATDPGNIETVSTYTTRAVNVSISDQIAYISTGSDVELVNIADISSPALISSLPSTTGFTHIDGERLYIRENSTEIAVYDIANPSQPAHLGTTSIGGSQINDVTTVGHTLYVASNGDLGPNTHDMYVINAEDPATMKILAVIDELQVSTRRLTATPNGDVVSLNSNRGVRLHRFIPDLCPADLTNDCSVDFFDVSTFLSLYSTQDETADLNNDNNWDFFDVSLFLQLYNEGCLAI